MITPVAIKVLAYALILGGMSLWYLFFKLQMRLLELILITLMLSVVTGCGVLWITERGYIAGDMPRYFALATLGLIWVLGGAAWGLNAARRKRMEAQSKRIRMLVLGWGCPGLLLMGLYLGFSIHSWVGLVLIFASGPIGAAVLLYASTKFLSGDYLEEPDQ